MINFLIFISLLAASSQSACTKKNNLTNESKEVRTIEIFVTKTGAWCGGMRPTEDMMQEIKSPKPLRQNTFYIKKGTVNSTNAPIFKTVTTDTAGLIQIDLPEGDYIIVNEDKKDKNTYDAYVTRASKGFGGYKNFNLECYEEWFSKPDGLLHVSDSSLTFKVNYSKRCWYSPCMTYTGPYPP